VCWSAVDRSPAPSLTGSVPDAAGSWPAPDAATHETGAAEIGAEPVGHGGTVLELDDVVAPVADIPVVVEVGQGVVLVVELDVDVGVDVDVDVDGVVVGLVDVVVGAVVDVVELGPVVDGDRVGGVAAGGRVVDGPAGEDRGAPAEAEVGADGRGPPPSPRWPPPAAAAVPAGREPCGDGAGGGCCQYTARVSVCSSWPSTATVAARSRGATSAVGWPSADAAGAEPPDVATATAAANAVTPPPTASTRTRERARVTKVVCIGPLRWCGGLRSVTAGRPAWPGRGRPPRR
jgi:hypothetical protein